ncbi:MAG: alpha/beta fold hydrolase [Saprospiraceae bacterium]|nr:alpha/beta hydrolase [Bacteroidia bacterium]NNE16171.1 alpha/beta fold hydrolase [Saprospiraceae bacterium]NNL92839.1 alpha/beta fold hydrolase [Saprospiraceae bacterium]
MFKYIKWPVFIFIFFAGIGIITINLASYAYNAPQPVLKEYFDKLATEFTLKKITHNNRSLRYLESGLKNNKAPLLVFIHGAPGSIDQFKTFHADYDLKNSFKIISVDRLGYGESDRGRAEININVQAEVISKVLKQYDPVQTLIIAHDYGCNISALIAAKDSTITDGIIMYAPSINPTSKHTKWYHHIINNGLFRTILPDHINVSTVERINQEKSLSDIKYEWQKINCPILFLSEKSETKTKDNIEINFAKNHIPEHILHIKHRAGIGHLHIWKNKALLKNIILEFLADQVSPE